MASARPEMMLVTNKLPGIRLTFMETPQNTSETVHQRNMFFKMAKDMSKEWLKRSMKV